MSDVNLIGSFGPKNRWQKKTHATATVQSSATTLNLITFSGLEIGKVYKIFYAGQANSNTTSNSAANFQIVHNGEVLETRQSSVLRDSTELTNSNVPMFAIFNAENTTVAVNLIWAAGGQFRVQGAANSAYLVELNNFESETADFT